MSNLSSPETTTITTFSSPRSAPHPRVIPLFSSTVSRWCFGQPSIHKELRSKPLFHPYPTTKRPTPLNVVDSSSSGDAPAPSSPLTPMTDEHPHERTESSIPILTPPPPGTLTVASLKLPTATSRDYRVIAKSMINSCNLDINSSLSEQDSNSKEAARSLLEEKIPCLSNHEDH
ncbi:hypothetical protein BT96DRAFT_1006026 [Gymnopus androsaceus JB14]|uniref:Uncharacterized protein n=1 Tax=Gymnopus androsaceus JB14 TaxID=1447944 RepID=A0A6A4GM09_9AGAR|nr:hypothetical protein BT96DRAFT_1006026 [Gymnopus androsaceus JB14]